MNLKTVYMQCISNHFWANCHNEITEANDVG